MVRLHPLVTLLFVAFVFVGTEAGPKKGTPQTAENVARPKLASEPKERVELLEEQLERLWVRRDYKQMVPLAEEVLEIRKRVLGESWWETVDTARSLELVKRLAGLSPNEKQQYIEMERAYAKAWNLFGEGKFLEAFELARSRLPALKRSVGENHPEVADAYNAMGVFQLRAGNYAEAETLHRRVLAMRREILGDQHPGVAAAQLRLAGLFLLTGEFDEAERLLHQALEKFIALEGDDALRVAHARDALASLLRRRGNYEAAEPLFQQALATRLQHLGPVHAYTAHSLNNLAVLHLEKGDYAAAEPLLREALFIMKELHPEGNTDIAMHLANLGSLYRKKGNWASAERYLREALALRKKLLPEAHAELADALTLFASLYNSKRDYPTAEQNAREALSVNREVYGKDHPRVATGLHNLGRLRFAQGDVAEAEQFYNQALAMHRRLLGANHADRAALLQSLARLQQDKGDLEAAHGTYREALALRRKLLGDDHPAVIESLFALASVHHQQGDYANASPLLREALATAQRQRTRIVGREEERAAYADVLRLDDIAAASADVLIRIGRAEEALEAAETGRGRAVLDLLARADRDLMAEVRATGNSRSSAKLDAGIQAETTAAMTVRETEAKLKSIRARRDLPETEQEALLQAQTEALQLARARLRDAEADILATLRQVWPDARPATTTQIQEELASGELLLLFSWAEPAVNLLVVPPAGTGAIEGFLLADGIDSVRELAELTIGVRDELARRPGSRTQSGVHTRYRLWNRLVPSTVQESMLSAQRVVVVPDGPIRDIALEVLVVKEPADPAHNVDARLLLDAGPTIVYADSATVYLNRCRVRKRQKEGPTPQLSALVLADPNFEHPTQPRTDRLDHETAPAPGTPGVGPPLGSAPRASELLAVALRSPDEIRAEVSALDQIRLYGEKLAPLPATRREAHAIAKAIRRAGGNTLTLMGDEANLANLEAGAARRRLLHLATHGLTGSRERPFDASLALSQPVSVTTDDTGFLTLDRLVRQWRGRLRQCELVVLSACDTQTGVSRGDSTMALAWGFMYAGAPSVVASLWKVDDTATRLLMERFYENLLGQYSETRGRFSAGKPMPKDEALREAKVWLRGLSATGAAALVQRGGLAAKGVETLAYAGLTDFSHPFFWAGFVLIGAPD